MRTARRGFPLSLLLLAAGVLPASALPAALLDVARIRELTAQQVQPALALYREFLSLPNDAQDPHDILRLVDWLEPQFAARGFRTERLPTEGSPLLFAERLVPQPADTVLVYLQADGQPVDRAAWAQADPYRPALKERDAHGDWQEIPWQRLLESRDPEWRIFARSAADSKGPMTQFLVALSALDAAAVRLPFNLKVIVDTEEELGSPHLAQAVAAHRAQLAADMLLIFDGPPHASNRPTVSFGARGIATITLTAWGPKQPQHSGHYGNFVPNPALHLAQILASMKSQDGRVLIAGYYDGIALDEATRAHLDAVPDDIDALQHELGFSRPDGVAPSLQEALQYPSLNIRGLAAGWVGAAARTIIPATATAELDIRLVPESDAQRLIGLVRAHIRALGYFVTDGPPTDAERAAHPYLVSFRHAISYGAFRSDFDAAAGRLARAGMRHLYGHEPILVRTMGGSIPIAPFVTTLGVPAATVATVNIDKNQHSPNENIRLGSCVEGISIILSVLSQDTR